MFRNIISVAQKLPVKTIFRTKQCVPCKSVMLQNSFTNLWSRNMSILQRDLFTIKPVYTPNSITFTQQLLKPQIAILSNSSRSVTKFSLKKGKRKTVKCVLKRFKRLHWGIWIRTRSGRHKKMFKKSPALKRRLKQHVFVNAQQSWLLDSMVTNYWRKPKYYVDDPYEQYHKREEYFATRKKPLEYKTK
ncbi:39S ribosomal protein L35, mitochondrial [Condylostylus longicornis]|uniref:39S ribosomal protein L35, mitochondrial n=1 Tax=Condylostylus longicornis TaxID=2530218 RepID=UPI00244DBC97|nr:39S ribosomal protein L35, mitochondrial [Condylostylus longicornis]